MQYSNWATSVASALGACVFVGMVLPAAIATAQPEAEDAVVDGAEAIVLTGDTSDPELSTFVRGEPGELTFRVDGLASDQTMHLMVRALDEHDQELWKETLPVSGNTAGQWTTTIEARTDRLGFYRVEAALSDGTKLAPLGTRPGGYLTYAVVPDPAQRKDYGESDSRFGMQGGFGPWGNRSLALLGARWVLDGSFEWRRNEPDRPGQMAESIEKSPDKWRPPSPKPWQSYALPTFFAAPKWGSQPGTLSYMTGSLLPEHEASWQAYCRDATRAFMTKYPDQSPRIYQITWEPMPPWGFKGQLPDLVRIYELAYPVIHAMDPDAVVAGPTLGLQHDVDMQTTAEVLSLGLADYLDAYTAHPYFSMTPERDHMVQRLRRMRQALQDANDGDPMPMYGTEQGQNTMERRENELEHARALLRQNLIMLGEGYAFNMTFYIVDYHLANQKGYGYYYNLVDDVPWGPAKAGPKPIVPGYAAQSLLLDGTHPVRPIHWLGETAMGYAFERGGEVVLALWDYGQESRQVVLPVGAERVTIHDWMGNSQEATTNGQQAVELTLGPEPVYVTGASASLWGSAGRDRLTLAPQAPTLPPGETLTLQPSVAAAPHQSISGTVVLTPDPRLGVAAQERSISVEAGQQQSLSLDLAIAADVEPGRYPVRVELNDGDQTRALAGDWVRIVPAVTVRQVEPALADNGTPLLHVTLANQSGGSLAGRLSVTVPELSDQTSEVDYQLDTGASDVLTVQLPDADVHPLHQYVATIRTADDRGRRAEQTEHVNWFAPPRLSTPPTIDGELDDWPGRPIPMSGGNEPEGQMRVGWDDHALYLAAEVHDPTFVQRWDSHITWRGDSLQVVVNLDPQRKEVASGNELADAARRARATRLLVAQTKNGVEVYRHSSHDNERVRLGMVSPDQVPAAVRQDEDGLVYELAIPWSAIGGAGTAPGDLLGLSIDVIDLDVQDWNQRQSRRVFTGDPDDSMGLLLLRSEVSQP